MELLTAEEGHICPRTGVGGRRGTWDLDLDNLERGNLWRQENVLLLVVL